MYKEDSSSQKSDANKDTDQSVEKIADATAVTQTRNTNLPAKSKMTTAHDTFNRYKKIIVDGGDLSGSQQVNVVINIGFGD